MVPLICYFYLIKKENFLLEQLGFVLKIFIIIFLSALSFCYSQESKISGIIRDANSREVLPYANISVKDIEKGVSADAKGKYEIFLPKGNYLLLVSYIGYKTETIPVGLINKDIRLNINLIPTGVILQEISVYSTRGDDNATVSSASLQSKEMEEISSVFPDVFRSIQSLPGIAVNNEFSAKFNVRGGNFDENLVLVNGSQVYEPFHIKEADNASVGIFNMDLMKRVSLITGGFSAQYGDRLSSVLDIEYREGNKERQTGSATLSLIHLDAVFEGPLGLHANYILGLRKSYFEYVLALLDVNENNKPSFYDVQGVVTYDLTDANKLQLKFIHAGDDFVYDPPDRLNGPSSYRGTFANEPSDIYENRKRHNREDKNYYSNLFDLKNTLFLSGDALLNTSVSYYQQIDRENELATSDYDFNAANSNYYFYQSLYSDTYNRDLEIKTWEGKTTLNYKLTPFYEIKNGFSYLKIKYEESLNGEEVRNIYQNIDKFPDTISLELSDNVSQENITASSYKLNGYIENVFQVNENTIINVGGRIDYFDFNKDLTLSPRISASYRFGDGLNLRVAWGHYYQSPIYRQLAYSTASDSNTQSQKAEHYIIGLEKNFSLNQQNIFTLKVEGYYKKYTDLISSERGAYGNITYSRKNDSKGYAKGIDFYASLKFGVYYGWISYGLLFAKEDLYNDARGEFPRYTDQRHTFSFINDFNLGNKWSINLRFTYGSGFAYTPYYTRYNNDKERYEWVKGEINSGYLPAYKRIDIRVGKEFTIFNLRSFIFLDVNNLLDFKNVNGYKYWLDNNGNPYREAIELWPIIPSLGLTVRF